MEPSLELITRKQLKFAFGLYQTYKYNMSTQDFPELTTFLRTQSNKMDLSIQNQGNSTDNFHRIKKSIENLNNKVGLVVLAEASNTPKRSPKDILRAPFYKTSPNCSDNKTTSFGSMLILNFVSILILRVILQSSQ